MAKGTLSLIYKKSLDFPLIRNPEISAGNIMTYMSVDVENVAKIFSLFPHLVQFPVIILIGISILYASVGMAFIGGFVSVIFTGLSISLLTKKIFG